jgi:hypothetical protein
MLHSTELLQEIPSPTPRYATQREISIKILWSTPRYAEKRRVDTYLQISLQNQNQIRKYVRMIINDLGRVDW